jgi:Fe-S cluster assembly iron-binding protein IscA
MIDISTLATKELIAYLEENKINSPIRIGIAHGCGGPSLGLSLDERKGDDYVLENESFTLLIDQILSKSCGKVLIDYLEKSSGCGCSSDKGFAITSEKPLSNAGKECECSTL